MEKTEKIKTIPKFAFLFWFFCILGFLLIMVIFQKPLNEMEDLQSFTAISFLGIGILSFLLGTITLTWIRLNQSSGNKSSKNLFFSLILQPIFPLYFLYSTFKLDFKSKIKNSLESLLEYSFIYQFGFWDIF